MELLQVDLHIQMHDHVPFLAALVRDTAYAIVRL